MDIIQGFQIVGSDSMSSWGINASWLIYIYGIWLIVASIVTFILYGHDKAQSKKAGWRVPEKVLHVWALVGGFIGGWIGRSLFHHKTQKGIFVFVLTVSTLIHAGISWWLIFK